MPVKAFQQKVNGYTANQLSTMIGHWYPDSHTSPGAEMLRNVRDSVCEAIDYGRIVAGEDRSESGEYRSDVIQEIANGAPSQNHPDMWAQFTDLVVFDAERDTMSDLINQIIDGIREPLEQWKQQPPLPGYDLMFSAASAGIEAVAYRMCVALCEELDKFDPEATPPA